MNINNPGHQKVSMLTEGISLDDGALDGVGTKYEEKIYSYSLTDWVTKKVALPSDVILEPDILVGFRLNNDSRWAITNDNGSKILSLSGTPIREVDFASRSAYYDHNTRDGTPMKSIGVSCGNHGVSFFVNTYCEYFRLDENCRFCSLVPSQKKFNDTLKKKKPEHVAECLDKILELSCKLDFIQLSGGSFYDHDIESEMYLPYVKAISDILQKKGLNGKIPMHLTCMPPNNLELIDKLKDQGLDTISFDLECPTKEYFDRYCPGKSKSKGYTKMREALAYASSRLGCNKVYTIVICGIEPEKSFVKGVKSLLEEGITTTLNIYHHDPLSAPKMDISQPDVERLIDMLGEISVLFKEYNVKPGSLGCAHYDIGHEICKGYFENAKRT